jgi:hypothetical protein
MTDLASFLRILSQLRGVSNLWDREFFVDSPPILSHALRPIFDKRIILEHADELGEVVWLRPGFQWHHLGTIA